MDLYKTGKIERIPRLERYLNPFGLAAVVTHERFQAVGVSRSCFVAPERCLLPILLGAVFWGVVGEVTRVPALCPSFLLRGLRPYPFPSSSPLKSTFLSLTFFPNRPYFTFSSLMFLFLLALHLLLVKVMQATTCNATAILNKPDPCIYVLL